MRNPRLRFTDFAFIPIFLWIVLQNTAHAQPSTKDHQTSVAQASELVLSALGFLGVPYKRGGDSFESGFDCSGFVQSLYAQNFGMRLPRSAAEQANSAQHIEQADLEPGDLVFYNTLKRPYSHVGIYIGERRFIHSPKPGSAVRIERMDEPYWISRFNGARRVLALSSEVAPLPLQQP